MYRKGQLVASGFGSFPHCRKEEMLMANHIEILKCIYDRFNARDIDGVPTT
jgi:hypothetical protein